MRTREMRRLEYQEYIIENPDCRQMWDKWSFLIIDVGTKIHSNWEYVEALNNSSYGISANNSGFDFWIYSHKLSDILPPERIKFDLLNEIDSTLKLLNFNREKENYLERFQYEIIAIYMTYTPVLSSNSYYGNGIDKTSAGYKAKLVRCSTAENKLKFNLHEFYQYLLKLMLEISLVEEYIIEKLIGLEDAQIVPNDFYTLLDNVEIKEAELEEVPINFEHFSEISLFMDYTKEKLLGLEDIQIVHNDFYTLLDNVEIKEPELEEVPNDFEHFSEISLFMDYTKEKLMGLEDVQIIPDDFYPLLDNVEIKEVLPEEVTLDMIYRELKCSSYQLVMMYVIGDFVPFYKENFNQPKLGGWTKLVYEKIGVNISFNGFRPTLAAFTSEWDKPIKSKRYNAVVTGDAKKAVSNIIKKYPIFFKNKPLNEI